MRKNKRIILVYIVSLFLSFSIVCSLQILHYYVYGANVILEKLRFNIYIDLLIIFLSILIFILLSLILNKLKNIDINPYKKVLSDKKVFIISYILIFFFGLMFLLIRYPGTAMVDSYQLISDPIGYSMQYPLIYSIISSKVFYFVYGLTNSMNFAFFTLGISQLSIMSFLISYTILWQHKKVKSNKMTSFFLIYFSIVVIFSNLNTAHLRDTFFSGFFLILITIIYDIINTDGNIILNDKFLIKYVITVTGLMLSRNNGILIASVITFYFFIKFYKYYKQLLVIVFTIGFIYIIPKFMPNNFEENLFQESVAVPFQQLAYSINEGNVSEEDKTIISEIIPIEYIEDNYNGFTFDRLKWSLMFNNFKFNNIKKEFIDIWLKNMIPNYKLYFKAYLVNTCDLWAFTPFRFNQGVLYSLQIKDVSGTQYFDKLENKIIFPEKINDILFYIMVSYNVYLNNGMIFWIYVILYLVLIYKNNKKYSAIFLPFILIWVNLMLMSPLASAFRYMAMFGYCLPLVIAIVFKKREKNSTY